MVHENVRILTIQAQSRRAFSLDTIKFLYIEGIPFFLFNFLLLNVLRNKQANNFTI